MSDTQPKRPLGGIIHTYQRYDPQQFPSPTQPPPDLVSGAFEHALMYGEYRELTEEELARAVRLDPSQIAGLGPSLESLRQRLLERKRQILERYEMRGVLQQADKQYRRASRQVHPPTHLRQEYFQAVKEQQIYLLERLWYRCDDDQSPLAIGMMKLMERLAEKYAIEELAGKYEFTGHEGLSVPEALRVKEELEEIDRLLKQLEEAAKTAQIGLIDIEALQSLVGTEDLTELEELRRGVQNYLRELAERQGLERTEGGQFRLTPQAYRLFQGKLLERIFSHLQPGRSGRHSGRIQGEGSVELPQTAPYQFGDSLGHLDVVQSVINAMLARPDQHPVRLGSRDLEVHRTRHSPKCGTLVIMDMSGSMRYDGQYINVKRMALALQALITREYPGDLLRFIEMSTFARLVPPGELVNMMPKPVTIHDPWVRLKVDMSRDDISRDQVHPHFTNIQHSLHMARQHLAAFDSPNRQIILITDGLPTAHFEQQWLYMLYPPDPQTELATLREGRLCAKAGITINLFLVPSWSQSEEDIRFAYRLAESTRGRVFFTAGRDLDRCVLWDYLSRKREILG